jgi:hypothetical protein
MRCRFRLAAQLLDQHGRRWSPVPMRWEAGSGASSTVFRIGEVRYQKTERNWGYLPTGTPTRRRGSYWLVSLRFGRTAWMSNQPGSGCRTSTPASHRIAGPFGTMWSNLFAALSALTSQR